MLDDYFNEEEEDANSFNLTLTIATKNEKVKLIIEKNMKVSDFYGTVAEICEQDPKKIRLIYQFERIQNNSNVTMGDYFDVSSNMDRIIEVTAFFETLNEK